MRRRFAELVSLLVLQESGAQVADRCVAFARANGIRTSFWPVQSQSESRKMVSPTGQSPFAELHKPP